MYLALFVFALAMICLANLTIRLRLFVCCCCLVFFWYLNLVRPIVRIGTNGSDGLTSAAGQIEGTGAGRRQMGTVVLPGAVVQELADVLHDQVDGH